MELPGGFVIPGAPHLRDCRPLLPRHLFDVLDTVPPRMASLLAARMRLYVRDMRISWRWFFATLFELEEYASALDRVLRDFDSLDPSDPPLSEEDVSYMHFLLAEWEVSFDHSCENVVWFFFHAHLPCWRILLGPATAQRLRE